MKHISKFVVVLILILGYNYGYSQDQSNFIRLSKTFVGNSKIIEDDLGFMWVSDRNGLHKYDGYNFYSTSFKEIFGAQSGVNLGIQFNTDRHGNFWLSPIIGSPRIISSNNLKTIVKDSLNFINANSKISAVKIIGEDILLGSEDGTLFSYDESTGLEQIIKLPWTKNSSQIIKSIAKTSTRTYISTNKDKLYYFDMSSKNIEELIIPGNSQIGSIRLITDKQDNLWIATELQGIFKYDTKQLSFKQYDQGITQKLKFSMFISVYCDSAGNIWAGTDGDGLYKINPSNDKVNIFTHDEINNFTISNNTITFITEDKHRNKWVVTKNGQINLLPNNDNNIKFYSGSKNNSANHVLSILKSSDGSLWLGTDGNGLNRVLPSDKIIHYGYSENDDQFFNGRFIHQLIEDKNGNIWIATYQNGLWFYDLRKDNFSKINTHDTFGNYSPDIRELFKDSENRIWATSSVAINVFSDDGDLLNTYNKNEKGLFGEISNKICQDEMGNIWVGYGKGLFKLLKDSENLDDSYFTDHNYFSENNSKNTSNHIKKLKSDFNGNLWILTTTGFLIKYDIKKNKYISFQNKIPLKGTHFTSFLIDDPDNIWLGSLNGIHHYQLESNSIKSFYQTDGLWLNSFQTAYKDYNDVFYFGGNAGVNSFLPHDLVKKETGAKLFINSIEVLNKSAKSILPDQFDRRIEHVDKINLNANQSSFSFQFAAIDNLLDANFHYQYRLKGFDNSWIIPKGERIATYTNIPSGSYTFEVKASSKKGEWNIASKAIKIKIKPPWWFTFWAYSIYLILFALILYGVSKWVILKNKLAKEEWQHKKEEELYTIKMNFFAKMSHEIQTPLTLILGPIDDMLFKAKNNGNMILQRRLTILKNNTNRLSRIAKELMTVRNKELGKLKVYASKNNLKNHLSDIAVSFSEQASFKNIDLQQDFPVEEIMIWYDLDKIEHVIYNLMSNAIKFTPREGRIVIKLENSSHDTVKICISDSGPGIPKNELEEIFKIFYQTKLGRDRKGLGIGLALTKEMVALHHGEINVESSAEKGTCFSVLLSKKENIFFKSEKIVGKSKSKLLKHHIEPLKQLKLNVRKGLNNEKLHTLLIVEDNIEMQMFLKDVLKETYNLLFAENGKQGVSIAEKSKPDLIISDIMMPLMNGIEMCKILQHKKSTSHIPIIFLTAKNSDKFKLLGLETGAIVYLRKPFNFYELQIKINNIITNQEKILTKYKTDLSSKPKENNTKSKEEVFMKTLVKILDGELENSDFKLEDLSTHMHMSYSVIYRKCYDITGKSLVEFVRSLKLKKAAILILNKGYNVSEAAFTVGYKDPKYFTKCFKAEFKTTPNNMKKEVSILTASDVMKKYKINI